MRAAAVVWLLFERNEAESSHPRSAHPARSREEILIFEFVVPPVCGRENLPRKKCRAQKSPSFTAHFFAEKEVSAWLRPPHKIFLPSTGGLIIGKRLSWAGRYRAGGIERVEDLGPEPRNVGQENFVGRKIFRRLTSPLAATLPAVATFLGARNGN